VETRAIVAGLAALRLAIAVPYAVMGPALFMDDWWVLRNIRFHGVLAGAGPAQALARPGAWLLFNLEFGLFGDHPLALYVFVTVVNVGVTVALFLALCRLTGPSVAAAVAAVHAVLPNHASLDHWASAIGITVALLLALSGVAVLARAYDEGRPMWPAIVLFAAGGLCYEAVLVIAVIGLVAVPVVLRHQVRRSASVVALGTFAAIGLWMLAHTQKVLPSGRRFADFSLLWPGHFGRGIAVDDRIGRPTLLIVTIVLTVLVARLVLPSMRTSTGRGERLVACGLLVLVLGAVPFAKFPISVLGVNDRANVVSAVGSAIVWVGVAVVLRRWPALLVVATAAWVLVVVPARWEKDRDWSIVGAGAARIVDDVATAFPEPSGAIVIGPEPLTRHGVVALVSDWDTSAALQLTLEDASVVARTAPSERSFCRSRAPLAWDIERRTPDRRRCP
jgi:hypothetical protein